VTEEKAGAQTIKQKADAEAARAEAEEPETQEPPAVEPDDDDTDPEHAEPEPEQEPQAKRAGKSPQEQFERAFQAFRKKCADIFEVPVAEVQPAPHPGVVGIMLPGFAEPRTHENYKRCQTCNGLGKVLTEAQTGDAAKDWHVCPDQRCKGQGYWTRNTGQPEAPTTGPLAVQSVSSPNGEFEEAPTWMGDPNVTPVTPAGV
jgi:hypothetical protein